MFGVVLTFVFIFFYVDKLVQFVVFYPKIIQCEYFFYPVNFISLWYRVNCLVKDECGMVFPK